MKTRDRILVTSLAMFNEQGEPNVSTNHIADELEISPGNLYYHFRNKDDIVEQLFSRYENRIDTVLALPEDRLPNLEDIWLQLHLIFECMAEYRFIYRDLVDLTSRNRKLRVHFARIIKHKVQAAEGVLNGLVSAGILSASRIEIQSTAQNISLVATFWADYQSVKGSSGRNESADPFASGIYQVMMLVAPYLRQPERGHLSRLAQAYIS